MSSRLTIRPSSESDIEQITDIYNYYVRETHVTFDLEEASYEARRQWQQHYNKNPRHRLLVGEIEGQVIGYVSSSQFRAKPAYDRSVETTVYLTPGAQGQGYGKLLYTALFSQLKETDLNRCYAIIALPNDASIALHHNFGFATAGRLTSVGYKFDKYWDTLWMEKSL
jgi:phosphinothricin acetyltransferase